MIPSPSVSEPRAAARKRDATQQVGVHQRLCDPPLDESEADRSQHRQDAETDGRSVDPVAALRECGDEQGHRGHQQRETGYVDPPRVGGPGLLDPRQAGPQQDQRHHADDGVRLAPAGPDVERCRQDRAGGDAEPDARSPDRRRVHPRRTRCEVMGEHGQTAGEHRRSADSLEHPCRDEEQRLLGDGADQGAHGDGAQSGGVDAPPTVGVAEDAGGQQRRRQADRHRAEDPGPADRPGAQVRGGRRDRRHRGHVGDQHQGGPERHREQRAGGRGWFDIQTHSRHATRVTTVPLAELPGRPCPIAASLELVGERWALLVVREIAMGSTRFSDIVRGTGAPRDRIAARLKALEAAGVIGAYGVPAAARALRLPPDRVGPGPAVGARCPAGVGRQARGRPRRPPPARALPEDRR